ncbi:MAG: rhomboid family intramembrane serine protease [Candidatus Omnitrophica bacterium]|nr:rhomboid family intramembrane serine protease [Candidatus Omnitrophota bacterium]MBU4479261.1 rhomboid family intramembrane serine protease [Candidatus Omnitrophota bacterium]MCG2703063.1 rhomboid family intramembrane serine protease [Candidatus Omnitrophota bacterium]
MLPCSEQGTCIAWWAHIGGFIAGVVLTLFFKVTGRIRR